jgi:diaminohydroxyphosphoribosylaminopyrimidine deaminase / 5-amino-6-(5-phosphoribosylamino)uracil reductase
LVPAYLSCLNTHELYMQRCLQLALLAAGKVAPNPMVGAVLVYKDQIIGEGYHMQYGGPHAEVNCINNVPALFQDVISQSTLYVSLEPCAHFGKTPPCADLIIKYQIPTVVVGIRDPFEAVNGKGIEKLQQAGVEVITGVLENKCRELNKRFFTFHIHKRPYIILKWAQTRDGFIATNNTSERLHISNSFTNRLVHKWRSEEAAILVGTKTALADDPALSNRLWTGKNPVRLVIDKQLKLPQHLQLFNRQIPTIVFNEIKEETQENLRYWLLNKKEDFITQFHNALYQLNLTSVLVEGGSKLLQSFIDARCYDEIRLIENTSLHIGDGIAAPHFPNIPLIQSLQHGDDCISIFQPLS